MKPSHELPKSHHAYVPAQPAADPLAPTGYVEKEYEHQEYPKHVTINGETYTATSETHELELHERFPRKKSE